jgi:hypothetical protein
MMKESESLSINRYIKKSSKVPKAAIKVFQVVVIVFPKLMAKQISKTVHWRKYKAVGVKVRHRSPIQWQMQCKAVGKGIKSGKGMIGVHEKNEI